MSLTVESARSLLGVTALVDVDQIARAHDEQRKVVQGQITRARTEVMRHHHQTTLRRLDEARDLLLTVAGPVQPHADDLDVDDVLADRYEIRERIGIGGMGAVYRAFDRVRGEDVAIKVLLPHLLTDTVARDRFLSEARIASKLSHPNIVNVYDVQRDGDKNFLTMELLRGQTLRQLIRSGQPFTVERAVSIGQKIGAALSHAHRYTIHRDIKPENIWIEDDGQVKLIDFGIARVLSSSQFTMEAFAMGTAYYMAPEQVKGARDIDHRADQYALAVVLYELIAGEVPTGRIKPLAKRSKKVPRRLSDAIDRALDSDPAARFPTIDAFAQALSGASSGQTRTWLIGALVAAALVVTVLVALPFIKSLSPTVRAERQAREAAIQDQAAIVTMFQQLDDHERELGERAQQARARVNDLTSQLSSASGNQAQSLREQLATAQAVLARANESQELAGRTIYNPARITQIRSRQTLGEVALREGDIARSAQTLAHNRTELSQMLAGVGAIEPALLLREETGERLERIRAVVQAEGDDPQPIVADASERLQQAHQYLRDGDFVKAHDAFSDASSLATQRFLSYAEAAYARHSSHAEALIGARDFRNAEIAIARARALELLLKQWR